jgi:2-desacetyl-2-hydroxyethyl bacteriochlorophyllide A dehydrogenase
VKSVKSIYIAFPSPNRVEILEEELPPPGPGEILCQATKSLISTGTETSCLRGIADPGTNWGEMMRYPFRPGYSMVAHVVATGKDVQGFREGDRVTTRTPHQQFFTVGARDAYRLPDSSSDEEAAFARLAGTTQLAARRASIQLGENVAVVGVGILGQLVVQYMALSGSRRVIAIDPAPLRLAVAQAHGATHAVEASIADAWETVAGITAGRMLEVVFDATGHPAVLPVALRLLHRMGRLVLLGDTPTPSRQSLGPGVISNSLSILGIHGTMHPDSWSELAPWSRAEMYDAFFDFLAQQRLQVADLITHRFSPLEAPAAYNLLERERASALGVLFDWTRLSS